MTQKLIKFHFRTPLHIGSVRQDYGISETMLHSDSIYSAIISAWATLGLDIPDLKNGKDLGFTISSLFPFYQKNKELNPIYFFPKPLGLIQPETYETHKQIKKIKYLDFESFKEVLKGNFQPKTNSKNIEGDFYLSDKNKNEEDCEKKNKVKNFDKDFMDSEVYARNRVPRYGEVDENNNPVETRIYYIDRIFFKGDSGLFCVAQFENTDIENKVMGALRYLQDEGIGTDRHVGNGLFEIEANDFEGFISESNYALNLSLFCPQDKSSLEKMLDEKSQYEILKRGGWISTEPYLTYRKKSVYMFKEGSIFNTQDLQGFENLKGLKVGGKTVDLKPENTPETVNHSVYRVGKSLFVPIKLE